jgi:hypothetical protein
MGLNKMLDKLNKVDVSKYSTDDLKNIGLDLYGLKCDSCDWEDMSIPFKDYEKNIDVPCPECGDPILTKKDYGETLNLVKSVIVASDMEKDDVDDIASNMSGEEMDKTLDTMNDMKSKYGDKTSENVDDYYDYKTWDIEDLKNHLVNLEGKIDEFFDDEDTPFYGDRGYQDLLEDKDNVESEISNR